MVDDGNLRMYVGRGTKIYLLPLLHRKEVSFDITCLATDSTPAPACNRDTLIDMVEASTSAWSRSRKGSTCAR